MSIVCPACKQENKGKDPAYCSYCYQPFKGANGLPEDGRVYEDAAAIAHPARQSFAPVLTKHYDLTAPLKILLTVLVVALGAFAVINWQNGGFYDEESVYTENGSEVHVHHFHILPEHNPKYNQARKKAASPSAKP